MKAYLTILKVVAPQFKWRLTISQTGYYEFCAGSCSLWVIFGLDGMVTVHLNSRISGRFHQDIDLNTKTSVKRLKAVLSKRNKAEMQTATPWRSSP